MPPTPLQLMLAGIMFAVSIIRSGINTKADPFSSEMKQDQLMTCVELYTVTFMSNIKRCKLTIKLLERNPLFSSLN